MTWAKVDDNFFSHPKAIVAGPSACLLYIGGLCYCNGLLTNGHIPAGAVRHLVPGLKRADAQALQLVAVGLWKLTPSGFEVHDYLQWNERAEDVRASRDALRAANRERQRRWRKAQANKDIAPDGNAARNVLQTPLAEPAPVTLSRVRHAPSSPTPTPTPTPRTSTATTPLGKETGRQNGRASDPRGFGDQEQIEPPPKGTWEAIRDRLRTRYPDLSPAELEERTIREYNERLMASPVPPR